MTKPDKSQPVDWTRVRERLTRAIAATEQAGQLSGERATEILKQRARALATPPREAGFQGETIDLVAFTLGAERYALETRHVREIVRLTRITRLPLAPSPFFGVVNLRGEILPLIDLGEFLGGRKSETASFTSALVIGEDAAEIGLPVASIEQTLELPVAALMAADSIRTEQRADCRLGVTGDALIVLDGDKLLADRRLFVERRS